MLTYGVARLILAVGLAAALWLKGQRGWSWIGQAVSDVACVTFVVAYADGAARSALGWFAAPLLLFVIAWETMAVGAAADVAAAHLTANELESPVQAFVGAWRWAWALLCVAPPVAAGGFLVFNLYAPNEWPFPDRAMGPRFACRPAIVGARDTVTLEMEGAHGEELGVFTPDGTFLYLMTPGGRDEVLRVRRMDRVSIDVPRARGAMQPGARRQPVFTQAGKYTFRWSEAAEINASQLCAVQYAP
jgi:hypothetical protein